MNIEISQVKPDETGQRFEAAFELHNVVAAELDPDADPDTEAIFRSGLSGSETFQTEQHLATVDGVATGLLRVWIDHLETNTDKAELRIQVHPDHRRLGVATALLRAGLDVCAHKKRSSVVGVGVNSEETNAFWKAFGADLRLVERESRLWLGDTDHDLMHDWVDQRMNRAPGYELKHWKGLPPTELLGPLAALHTSMNDAPHDDLDWEPDVWTEADVLDLEGLIIGMGRERWGTVALSAAGEPAGLTALSFHPDKPRFANQGNTVVIDAHRNCGIGRWLKGEMWLRLRSEASQIEAIDTDNAASNDPMLAINIAMGFRPLIEWGCWQNNAEDLTAHLNAR